MFSIIAYFFHLKGERNMKCVDDVVDRINALQKRYTYRNVFKDYLIAVASWNYGEHRFEDGTSFDDVVGQYGYEDLEELSRCAFALYNTGARNVNFLLAVNDTLNNEDHDEMHDFIIEKFS